MKKRSASKTDRELKAALTEHQPYKAAGSIHASALRVEYAAGVGQPKIINGLGTVADPQAGTNSNLKSIVLAGHPTGAGAQFLANWLAPKVQSIVTAG